MEGDNIMHKVLTIRQAAKAFNFPEFGMRRLVKEGKFPVIRCGNRCYISWAVLEMYFEKGGELYAPKR